jgi:hypothetical protein
MLFTTVVVPLLLLAQSPGIALDPPSRVRIGSADGEEVTLFNRISGAVRLSSGEIVVANQGSNELRWFSPTGAWLRTVGREGSGPGEFRGLRRLLLLPGDSLLAEDGLLVRMTLYDARGTLVRSWQISPAGSGITPPPIGRLADGSFVAVTERELSPPPGHTQYRAILLRYRDGVVRDTLVTTAGGEAFSVPCGTATSPGICGMGVPYGLRTQAAIADGRVFIGNGERYELLRITLPSGRVDTLRRSVPEVPLDAARRAYFVDSIVEGLPPARQALVRDRFAGAPMRRAMPFFDALLGDDRGRLWLARPQVRAAAMRTWDVLDADGALIGSTQFPSGLRITHIANGHVVGVLRDADGVEYVETYRLR